MSNWQQQIIDNANAIQQIINGAKNINQFNEILGPLSLNDEVGVWSILEGKTVKLKISQLLSLLELSYNNTESNLEKQFGAGAVTITAGANTTTQEICDHINSVGFTVTTGQMIFLALTVKKTISGQGYWYRQKYFFKRNNLVGTWGIDSTNGLIVPSDLSLYYDVLQSSFNDSEDNVYINLGDLGSTAIHTYLTDYSGDDLPGITDNILADDGSIYYFNCTAGGILVTYKYIGTLPKTIGVSTFDIGDFQVFASSGDEPSTIPTEEQIFGKRIEGNISGNTTLHWNDFSVGVFTLTAATELFDDMLPTGENTRPIELLITGDFALDLPTYWEARPSNDTYDGTVWNHLIVSCINGNSTEERVIYSLENLAT